MSILLKKIFRFKLRTKFFLSFLVIIFISTIMVNFFIYKIYESETINKSVSLSQNLVEQLSTNISYKTKDLENSILLKTQATDIFFNYDYSDNFFAFKRTNSISNLAISLFNSEVVVKDIFVQDVLKRNFYYDNSNPNNMEYKDTDIYNYIENNYETIKNKWGEAIWVTFKNNSGVIYIVRTFIDPDTLELKGVIGIGIKDEYFKNFYLSLEQANGGSIVIYDSNLKVLSCSKDMIPIAEHFAPYNSGKIQSGNLYKEYKNNNYIITTSFSVDNKWKVSYIISSDVLLKDAGRIKFRIIFLCLASVICALIIAIIISGSITSNIQLLLKKIKSVKQGDFSIEVEPNYHDEVGELFHEFNEMSGKLNDLIKKIAFEQVEKQNAEYNALQAQINPHFLYNTLESINSFAKINGQKEIVNIIQSLSYLLRMSISGKKSVVKLSDEINYVKNYLLIQKIILGDRIHVEYDIDSLVLDCKVPKLILQPVIENAILHGIEGMTEGGLIIISAHKEENLLINISDNGKGMDIDTINRMFIETDEEEEYNEKHTRIGLKSVNKRIKILYGNKYGIKVSSELGIGTIVEIIIPINTNRKD